MAEITLLRGQVALVDDEDLPKVAGYRWRLSIGRFDDEKIAALAYNEAAKQHFGNFALLNEV